MAEFPTKQQVLEYLELLRINEENLYRLPRVLVLRQLVDRSDFHLVAFLKDQGNTSRNICHDISVNDTENHYFLIEVDFYEDDLIIRKATRWTQGNEMAMKAY